MTWSLVVGSMLCAVALIALCPAFVLLAQVLAARGPRTASLPLVSASPRPRIAVLIPAHNEELGIEATLRALQPQCAPGDRIVVVADNCSDRTAALAHAAGAQVIEREDAVKRGKGYALDRGMQHLAVDPPEIVVIVDADCIVESHALERIARCAAHTGRPVQALYLMHSPAQAGLKTRVGEFAWVLKNKVRPMGGLTLGFACQLMGTGMAFPWAVLKDAPLASGNIVEDLQLGIDLARQGTPPLFCPDACVTSVFPTNEQGLQVQRTRWEHGHLATLLSQAPVLFASGLAQRRWAVAAMALDLAVPPLSALMLSTTAIVMASLLWALLTSDLTPLLLSALAWAAAMSAVSLAWQAHARHIISGREWLQLPGFVLSKLPMYASAVFKRQKAWVRTHRDRH